MLVDEIIRKFLPADFNHLNTYLRIHFMHLDMHMLCWREIKKADEAVFVTIHDEGFFSSGLIPRQGRFPTRLSLITVNSGSAARKFPGIYPKPMLRR